MIREHDARGQRRHPAMDTIEAMRAAQEISRRFARAADAAQFRDTVRLDAVFIKCLDQLRCDCIVAASCAESGVRALIVGDRETQSICILWRRGRLHWS